LKLQPKNLYQGKNATTKGTAEGGENVRGGKGKRQIGGKHLTVSGGNRQLLGTKQKNMWGQKRSTSLTCKEGNDRKNTGGRYPRMGTGVKLKKVAWWVSEKMGVSSRRGWGQQGEGGARELGKVARTKKKERENSLAGVCRKKKGKEKRTAEVKAHRSADWAYGVLGEGGT